MLKSRLIPFAALVAVGAAAVTLIAASRPASGPARVTETARPRDSAPARDPAGHSLPWILAALVIAVVASSALLASMLGRSGASFTDATTTSGGVAAAASFAPAGCEDDHEGGRDQDVGRPPGDQDEDCDEDDGDDDDRTGNGSASCQGEPGRDVDTRCAPGQLIRPPVGLAASFSEADMSVHLTWQPVEGAIYYNIYRGETPGGPYEGIGSSRETSFRDSPVPEGATYYYRVTAVDAFQNQSRDSEEATASTTPTDHGPGDQPVYQEVPTSPPVDPGPEGTPGPSPVPTSTPEAEASPTPTPATEPHPTPTPEPQPPAGPGE